MQVILMYKEGWKPLPWKFWCTSLGRHTISFPPLTKLLKVVSIIHRWENPDSKAQSGMSKVKGTFRESQGQNLNPGILILSLACFSLCWKSEKIQWVLLLLTAKVPGAPPRGVRWLSASLLITCPHSLKTLAPRLVFILKNINNLEIHLT